LEDNFIERRNGRLGLDRLAVLGQAGQGDRRAVRAVADTLRVEYVKPTDAAKIDGPIWPLGIGSLVELVPLQAVAGGVVVECLCLGVEAGDAEP
jgi:hypothetical protein